MFLYLLLRGKLWKDRSPTSFVQIVGRTNRQIIWFPTGLRPCSIVDVRQLTLPSLRNLGHPNRRRPRTHCFRPSRPVSWVERNRHDVHASRHRSRTLFLDRTSEAYLRHCTKGTRRRERDRITGDISTAAD